MNHASLIAWTSLYIGVGSTAVICAVLAFIVTAHELHAGSWRPSLATKLDMALVVPKIWVRWQKNYLLGAPAIAAIALAYAHHVGFAVFWHIEPNP